MRIACLVIGLFLYVNTACDGRPPPPPPRRPPLDVAGINIDLNELALQWYTCNGTSDIFMCECSAKKIPVSVSVPRCNLAHASLSCGTCLKQESLCPRYSLCEQCKSDGGDSCVTCPEGTFGTWCENKCTCHNGGTCERNGKCICPPSYEGINCETKKGCDPSPVATPPLQVFLHPPDNPVTAVYSCPSEYALSGQAVRTCVSGEWTSNAPTCRPKCPILSAPANGRLVFTGSDLVEGVSAKIECSQGYRLVGDETLTCMPGGKWNNDLPLCEEVASCPDPGYVNHADRTAMTGTVEVEGRFLQDSKIQFKCKEGFERVGVKIIQCTSKGSWSNRPPTCTKVATVTADCQTSGSDVLAEEDALVRIMCPSSCSHEDFKVWGTSIYRARSSVCQAAIHSSKITSSGGPVAIINNGNYSYFTGSDSNYVVSESYPGRENSFRFGKHRPQPLSEDSDECKPGLTKLKSTCVFISNLRRSYEEARSVCMNLGLKLEIPTDPEERQKFNSLLRSKGLEAVWADKQFQKPSEDSEKSADAASTPDSSSCPVVKADESDLKLQNRRCTGTMNYACISERDSDKVAICRDPGEIDNGKAQPIGRIDGIFYVGSSVEYSCDPLYYLKGKKSISCSADGTWSNSKPECIRVVTCQDLKTPKGGRVTYLSPEEASSAVIQEARKAAGPSKTLVAPIPKNLTETRLLPGFHRVDSRAIIECESNYYKFTGSSTRTCQKTGYWSGRQSNCIPVCGRSDSPRSSVIVNGNATDIGQWPWQGGIVKYFQDYDQWYLVCGASLLNEDWVITAAHCVTLNGTTVKIEHDKFQVYLGKYHRDDSKDDKYVQVRKIQNIIIHYDYNPVRLDADIALIQLDSPVELTARVQPICLPTEQNTRENLVEGKQGMVTGWGMRIEKTETYSETLQQAALPVVSKANCEKGYEKSGLTMTITDNMFCAGYKQGKVGHCFGDSGGPMVFIDESSKRWVLEGIVSWTSSRGCAMTDEYGAYTRISRFLDWIEGNSVEVLYSKNR